MKIEVFAPGRIEVLGNHTDYNDGLVLAAAIHMGVRVKSKPRKDRKVIMRTSADLPDVVFELDEPWRGQDGWRKYAEGVVRVFQEEKLELGGFEARIEGDLPLGSGLSSSAALEVGIGKTLDELFQLELEPMRLAQLCRRAEQEKAGVACGLLDQVSSIFAEEGHLLVLDCRSLEVRQIPWPDDCWFLVLHAGMGHALAEAPYGIRREECQEAARHAGVHALRDLDSASLEKVRTTMPETAYRRARHVIGENQRVLEAVEALERGDVERLGRLLNASQVSSQKWFQNSSPEQDLLTDLARKMPGVVGARLTGGGFGGAVVAVVRGARERVEAVGEAVAAAYQTAQSQEVKFWICRTSQGARRVE